MDPSTVIAVLCFVCALPQGVSAVIVLYDRLKPKSSEAAIISTKARASWVAILLIVGAISTGFLGGWLLAHPVGPNTVAATREKPCPISQQQTGDATTKGNNSPANSGNNNQTTYGSQPTSEKPKALAARTK